MPLQLGINMMVAAFNQKYVGVMQTRVTTYGGGELYCFCPRAQITLVKAKFHETSFPVTSRDVANLLAACR